MVEKAKTCTVCGNDIKGEYLQASLDEKLKPTENGAVVCSQECAQVYENKLPFRGRPIQHWSRKLVITRTWPDGIKAKSRS